jgi:adenylate cyclase
MRHRRLVLLLTGLLAAAAGLVVHETDALRRQELDTVDLRFALRGQQQPPDDVLLVLIDERTITALGTRYPFPRRLHARLLDRLREAGVRVIGYDVSFTEQTTVVDDNRLIRSVRRNRPVLLAGTAVNASGESNVFGGGGILPDLGARAGSVQFPLDPGGVFRRVPSSVRGLDHFAMVAAELDAGRRVGLSPDPAWIDYAGPPGTYPAVSFIDVLRGRVPAERLRDRIVLVGAALPTVPDLHATPTSGSAHMTGTEILANAMETVRAGAPLRSLAGPWDVVLIVLLPLLVPALGLLLPALRATALALMAGVGYLAGAQLAFANDVIVPVLPPVIGLLLCCGGGLAVHYLGAARERERTRAAFARFVPQDVVTDVLARADGDLRLGGEQRDCTILFADLRSFTTWSEPRDPREVIDALNRYLEEMTDAIMDHGGTLAAYMGDGIMAIFGAPLAQPDHADRALASAREMLDVRLARFNAWLGERGLGGPFRMGIGLNTGPVMSGNIGSERRVEYTAVGDTTNTASRLESMTKETVHQLLISDSTYRLLTAAPADVVEAGELPIRGRTAPLRVWGLVQERPAEATR